MAYGQLVAEGYIEAIPKKGYFVSDLENLYEEGIEVYPKEDAFEVEEKPVKKEGIDFSLHGVDMNYFPYEKWRRLMKECLIDDNKELFLSGKHQGDLALRRTIAAYIHQSRGVRCKPSQIIIGAGSDYLLLLLTRIFKTPRHVAIENPAYKQANTILESVGYSTTYIDLDEQGMRVDLLEKSKADLAYVTPSHQFPSGMVMPANRRQKLLAWGARENHYIIEDDYDSEFRYNGKPIPSLQGQDPFEKVIYIGTLSKAIAPGIRLSYMVLPASLLEQYHENSSFYYSTVSRIDQMVIGRFFEEGYFERHLNRMRTVYKGKHDLLINQIKKSKLPVVIKGGNAGLHILLEFGKPIKEAWRVEEKLVKMAESSGVYVYPLAQYCLRETRRSPVILLGFARMTESEIVEGIQLLEQIWCKAFTIENGNVIFNID